MWKFAVPTISGQPPAPVAVHLSRDVRPYRTTLAWFERVFRGPQNFGPTARVANVKLELSSVKLTFNPNFRSAIDDVYELLPIGENPTRNFPTNLACTIDKATGFLANSTLRKPHVKALRSLSAPRQPKMVSASPPPGKFCR